MSDNPSVQKSVLKHFHLLNEPSRDGKYLVKCRYCESKLVGYLSCSSNCLGHLKNKHRELYFADSHDRVSKNSGKYSVNDIRQQQLTDALVCFFIQDLIPLSVVDSDSFHQMIVLMDPCFKVSETIISNRLKYWWCKSNIVLSIQKDIN